MRRRILGGTGIEVSEYTLGAMMFGAWGNQDHDESIRMIHTALDAGINFVDTADIYSDGESEVIVGKALKGRRDDVVLATKGHFERLGGGGSNSRRWLTKALDASLRRLDVDHVDLYQVHRPDHLTDIDETLSALSDFVRAGKVRAVGSSVFPAEQIVEAQWVAERRGHVRFRTEQPPYSILNRGIEAHVLPTTQRYGMGVLTWGPLAAGWLSGRYSKPSDVDLQAGRVAVQNHKFDPAMPGNAAKLAATNELKKIAAELGRPLTHLALAFVRSHPAVTSAIIGPRTPEQLTDLLAGADLVLDDEVLDRIDEIVPPGVDLNAADPDYTPPALADKSLRRR
ncbi:aldo/keto reductase [Amycolatopsis viridis]|uniref:Aryl-alcohol dehydrogenase-like predicted oxidoreductase n=1 Tax=Amycolatopsis viridis TaxID=185678 RepID=A0ABX0ST12_9PSEU|nr:aldo/keto reductase [Amycolatopsis viridis]NIH78640.1 aryl-alcohol dehydrogenase-like predicted oxidoreductase [Amycolatopsis viridis]